MSKKKLDNITDFLKNEPYSSILNVLKTVPTYNLCFKNGLKPGQLMHLIVKGYKTDISRETMDKLRKYIQESIYLKNKIILDQDIAGETPHQGFRNYLNKLEKIGWTKRGKGGRIQLSTKYENELFRLENKEIFDLFSQNQIMQIDAKSNRSNKSLIETHLIYGFSNEIYNKMSKEWKDIFQRNLDRIDESFRNLQELKKLMLVTELDNIIENFKNSIYNKKIKQIPKEKNGLIWVEIVARLIELQYRGADIFTLSKKDFFYEFGIRTIKKEKAEEEYNGACKKWAIYYLGRDYDITLDDLFDILEWIWKNRDKFRICIPYEIAYSRFDFPESLKEKIKPNF